MRDVPPVTTAPSELGRAMDLHTRGEFAAAADIYSDLLTRSPNDARLLTQLGLCRLQQDQLGEAQTLLDRAIAADPGYSGAHAWRGEVLRRQGRLEPAIEAYRSALSLNPDFAPAHFNLALAEAASGNAAAARIAWRRFSELRPADLRVSRELGRLAFECGDFADAAGWFARQLALTPDDADAAYSTGLSLERMARLEEAIQWFARAAALAPRRAAIRNAAGVAHFNLGNIADALSEYSAALALEPDFGEAHSNLLMAMHHVEPPDHDGLFGETERWAKRRVNVQAMPRADFTNDRDPARRLRIGYLSPRFCGGPLAHFFRPLLEAHDRSAVHVTCYAVSTVNDDATAAMRAETDVWRQCDALDDDALVAMIRRDRVDILVDLVGHCPGHRLGVFARRGAPVQFTWMDYVGTTGVEAIDYFVTDPLLTPVDGPQRYTERVLRLPDGRLCYQPTLQLPPFGTPATGSDSVTFGSFNRLNKLGPEVIMTWSAILARVPGARLVLKATAFEADATRDLARRRFAAHGIDAARIDLRRYTAEAAMMREYLDIDVALDPFPHNGCTTTCDALSMGVQVIAIEGTSLAGRQGAAVLTACGLSGFIAGTRDEYIELAVQAARSGRSTVATRSALRERFLGSPMCDRSRFARAFEQLYRDAWKAWCEGDS